MLSYLVVTAVAILILVTVVLSFAGRLGLTSIRIKGSFVRVFSFEIDLGSHEYPALTRDEES